MTSDIAARNPNVMLVEGLSDSRFLWHIRNNLALTLSFDIETKSGRSALIDGIYPELLPNVRRTVGVLVDADDDHEARWGEVSSRIAEGGIQTPPTPDPAGTVINNEPPLPRVGIWIMPDNQSPGELEDFVIDMIPDDDPVWPRSVNYINGIPRVERRFTDGKIDRSKLYAWLATRRNPPHIGAAIGAGDFDLRTERCQRFVAWLERLYGDGSAEVV